MGPASAAGALKARLKSESKPPPALVISAGFAGSLTFASEVGTWILATAALSQNQPELNVWPGLERVLKRTTLPWNLRTVGTVNRILGVSAPEHETRGRGPAGEDVVDMESYALGRTAKDNRIPFSVLRLISDSPRYPLPEFLTRAPGLGTAAVFFREPLNGGKFVFRAGGLLGKMASGWEKISRAWFEDVAS